MTALLGLAAMTGPEQLPGACGRLLADFLRQVDDTDLLWLREIRDEAALMFGR